MGKRKGEKAVPEDRRYGIRRHLVPLSLIGACVLIAYSNSLTGTWALDDTVANKPVGIQDIQDLVGVRKVAYLTFLLNQQIAPFSPAGFRLFNILIHIFNSGLVYLLAYRTVMFLAPHSQGAIGTGVQAKRDARHIVQTHEERAWYAAILSSAVFALHPININAVAYIVQRMASLATLFVLLSLLCYTAAARSEGGLKKAVRYALGGLSLIAGVFSKENAVMAAPLILLYDLVFISRFEWKRFMRRALIIAVLGAVSLGVASYVLKLHGTLASIGGLLLSPHEPLKRAAWMAVDVYWTPLQHVLTEFRVVARYLLTVALPLPQLLVFDWWDFPVSTGLTEPMTTLLSLLLILSLTGLSVWQVRRFPLVCFGILWYLCAISLESFFSLGADLYFEHRNYLPLAGMVIGVMGQGVLSARGRASARTVWTAAVVLGIALGSLTFIRNGVWKESLTLWEDTYRKSPTNLRALMALGNIHMKSSEFGTAETYYRKVVEAGSRDKRLSFLNDSAYSLGMLYLYRGDLERAGELIDRFEGLYESYRPKILRAYYKALKGDVDGALGDYAKIVKKARGMDVVVVLTLAGDTYRRKGAWDEAIEHYERALRLDPNFSGAYYGMGVSYVGKRDTSRALDVFRKTISVDPDHVLALSDTADLLLITKARPEEALIYAERAVAKSPRVYQPYLSLAAVNIVLGREAKAVELYKRALEYGAPQYMVPYSKARAYYLRGDREKMQSSLSELRQYKDLPDQLKDIIR